MDGIRVKYVECGGVDFMVDTDEWKLVETILGNVLNEEDAKNWYMH